MPRKYVYTFGRFALFVIYAWFGALKILGQSPANPLVARLLEKTLPFISFSHFIIILGVFEVVIGVLFLMPRFYKIAFTFFLLHMVMVAAPLFMLPKVIWVSTLVPTLEGQYIIKNLALVSIVLFLASDRNY